MKSYFVDSFSSSPFKGNPAGVCFPQHDMEDREMQHIATEFGLSETAFVRGTDKQGTYTIRYFSPKKEIPLCGHATLAAAKIIFRDSAEINLHFITVGKIDLPVKRNAEAITMELPLYPTIAATVPPALLPALGLAKVNNAAFSEKNNVILLEIADDKELAGLAPDFGAMVNSCDNINGVLVTAPSGNSDYDFHYRYFWPWAGTNEDPVTGGVQTFLANYWAERLGKRTLKAFQSSARTGRLTVEVLEDTVLVTGQAVILLEGNFLV